MSTARRFTLFAVALLLAGCAQSPDPAPDSPSGSAVADTCSSMNAAEALATWAPTVPEGWDGPWDVDAVDLSTYDDCAALSWLVLPSSLGETYALHHILVFHHGEFVGTATEHPWMYYPHVELDVDGEALLVTYRWEGETTDDSVYMRSAESSFTWNANAERLERAGDLPSDVERLPEPYGPRSDYGGPRPPDAVPLVSHSPIDGGLGVLTIGEVTCEFYPPEWGEDALGGCGILPFLEESPFGGTDVGPAWWVPLGTDEPVIGPKGDAPYFGADGTRPHELVVGDAVHIGDTVCARTFWGLTCWNTETGHGAFMTPEVVTTF